MKCGMCGCTIEDGEDQWTEDDDGPFCEDCIEEAEANLASLDFRRIA
jgi:hypothetical protein